MERSESKLRRMIRGFELAACVAALCALGLSPAIAMAGEGDAGSKSDEEKKTARELYQLGNERYAREDYAGALEAFRGAHRIMGVPTTALGLGKALMKLGRLVEARAALLEVATYAVAKDEPPSFDEARKEAQATSDLLAERIPTLEVKVEASGAEVTVDGAPLVAKQALDPGTHVVQASAPGYVASATRVDLAEGETRVLQIALARVPPPPAPIVAPPPPAPAPAPEAPETTSPAIAVAIVSFSIGGAGLVVGAITGAVSLSAADELESLCSSDKVCPASAEETRERSLTAAHVSTAAFIAGGVGVGAGIVALVLDASSTTQLRVGPGSLTLTGAF
jgi:hypothetical protein